MPPRPVSRPGRILLAEAMSEAELSGHIQRLCADLGLLAYHTFDSRRSAPGYPDWHILGTSSLFREDKTERGRLTAAQREWLEKLHEAGHDVRVWRPSDLLSGRIQAELVAVSGLAVKRSA